MYLLFNSHIANLLLNINRGRNTRPNSFVVWNNLIVGAWALVGILEAWSRQSCLGPTEITSFMFLVLFKDGGGGGGEGVVSLRIHLFVSDVNQGNEKAVWIQDFLA